LPGYSGYADTVVGGSADGAGCMRSMEATALIPWVVARVCRIRVNAVTIQGPAEAVDEVVARY